MSDVSFNPEQMAAISEMIQKAKAEVLADIGKPPEGDTKTPKPKPLPTVALFDKQTGDRIVVNVSDKAEYMATGRYTDKVPAKAK